MPVVLAACFAAGNFAFLPLSYAFTQEDWGAFWVYLTASAIVAQGGLLACFFVFADAPFWRRLVGCYSAAIVLWGCWEPGAIWHHYLQYRNAFPTRNPDFVADLQFGALSLPLLALAIHSPLWFFRAYLRWELRRASTYHSISRPLSTGDYFVGTSVVAASVTLARLAPQREWLNPLFWDTWATVFACVAGASLVSVIPAMLLMFWRRDWRLGYGCLLSYSLFAGLLTIGVSAIIDPVFRGFVWPGELWHIIGILIVFVGFAAFLGAGMKAARDLGYELVLGQPARSPSEQPRTHVVDASRPGSQSKE